MSGTLNPGPLSIGNVVSAALRIYRDHFKLYFNIACQAYLWILVPIYGWAKFSALAGVLSRLVFQELLEKPESVREARRYVEPRMWRFFWQGILLFFLFSAVLLAVIVVFSLIGIAASTLINSNPTNAVIAFGVGSLLFIIGIIGFVWLVSRLFISPLPLAIEENVTATSAISRSWKLTKGYVWRIQGILFVAFLISIPISLIFQILTTMVQIILGVVLPQDSSLFVLLYFIIVVILSLGSSAAFLPFWQAIAAVVYFDLRTRREGLGIRLDKPKNR